MYIIDRLMNKNNPSKKLSTVIYGLLIINISMDLQTDKTR